MRQENAYGQKSVKINENAKVHSPMGTDNTCQQSPTSPKPMQKRTAREHLSTAAKLRGPANTGNSHTNTLVMSESNLSGQKTQPRKATERPKTAYREAGGSCNYDR